MASPILGGSSLRSTHPTVACEHVTPLRGASVESGEEGPVRTVITGGAGFVGSHLCERFLTEGHEVICVDNCITGNLGNIAPLRTNPRFTFLRHNVSHPLEMDGPVDAVLHFASPASPVDYLRHPIPTL